MGEIYDEAKEVYRAYVADGVPSSGPNEPSKDEIIDLFGTIDSLVNGALSGATPYKKFDDLPASTGSGKIYIVTSDPTTDNNGYWQDQSGGNVILTDLNNALKGHDGTLAAATPSDLDAGTDNTKSVTPAGLTYLGITPDVIPAKLAPESGFQWLIADTTAKKAYIGVFSDNRLYAPSGAITADLLDSSIGTLPDDVSAVALAPESDWQFIAGVTADGKAMGFKKDGTVVGYIPGAGQLTYAYTRPALGTQPLLASDAVLVDLGDSTAAGANASTVANRWINRVATALGISFVNLGISGQTAQQIAARFDAIPVTITLPSNVIPADTSQVAVSALSIDLLATGGTSTSTLPLTIADIPGTLTKQSNTTYYWNRTTAGSEVPIEANTPCHPDQGTTYRDNVLVVCMGTNSLTDPWGTLGYMQAVAQRHGPYFKRILFISPRQVNVTWNKSATGTALTNYNNLLLIERNGRIIFGDAWVDMRRFLIDDAISYLGLTATSQDLTDIANDVIPTQLRAGPTDPHSGDLGHQAEAYLIQSILTSRGYL